MKTWVWIGLRKKEKPVLHISKWSTCRRFERKKETEASILIIVFFFFFLCIFCWVRGYHQRVSFSAFYENPKDLFWPFLWICGICWVVMLASSGWETSLQVAYRRDPERNGQHFCWLICIYNIVLIKNNTVLGPFQDMAMTTPSFPRGFL